MTTQKQQALDRKARIATLKAQIAKDEAIQGERKAVCRDLRGVAKAERVLGLGDEQRLIDTLKLELARLVEGPDAALDTPEA